MSEDWQPAVIIHLRIRVSAANHQKLLAFLAEAIPFYESPGGIRISLLRDATDPRRYIERVVYRNEADYEADQTRVESDPQMREDLERWHMLLDGSPFMEVYRPCGLAK